MVTQNILRKQKGKCLLSMVLILDGNSEHVAHAKRKMDTFGEKDQICY